MKHYTVIREDGTEVTKGELLFTRDEAWQFVDCTHPRKIHVKQKEDPNGDDFWPNTRNQEFYANVFNVGIYDKETQEWTFALS